MFPQQRRKCSQNRGGRCINGLLKKIFRNFSSVLREILTHSASTGIPQHLNQHAVGLAGVFNIFEAAYLPNHTLQRGAAVVRLAIGACRTPALDGFRSADEPMKPFP